MAANSSSVMMPWSLRAANCLSCWISGLSAASVGGHPLGRGQAGQPGPGRPRRCAARTWLHVGCGPGHDRGRRHSCYRPALSQRHVHRLLLSWRRRRSVRADGVGWSILVGAGQAPIACSMISRGIRAPSRITPCALRTASANGAAQLSSQMSSAAEVFGSRLIAACAMSSSLRIPPTSASRPANAASSSTAFHLSTTSTWPGESPLMKVRSDDPDQSTVDGARPSFDTISTGELVAGKARESGIPPGRRPRRTFSFRPRHPRSATTTSLRRTTSRAVTPRG